MARIKFGMMMTDARGKLGGHVFTKARSGATVRTKVSPTNPRTSAQSSARGSLASLSQAWSALSEVQRVAWNSAAQEVGKTNIFGDAYFPSGKNYFTAVNKNLLLCGSAMESFPPARETMPVIDSITVDLNVTDGEFNVVASTDGVRDVVYFVVQASKPTSKGVFNFSGKWSQILVSPAQPTGAELYNAYLAKYGTPPSDIKISFQVYLVNSITGQATARVNKTGITYEVTP